MGWIERVKFSVLSFGKKDAFQMKHVKNENNYACFETTVTLENSAMYQYYFSFEANGRFQYYKKKNITGDTSLTKEEYWKMSVGFDVPKWAKGATMYHIFVDRYRKGKDMKKEPMPRRILHENWDEPPVLGPDENGLWTITLTCTPSAREYVFNIENLGYLRYRLRNIVELKSRYSYILFMYLENNRDFRKSWEVSLNELKERLGCTSTTTYNKFKYFNDLILKKCHQEINEKTDCKFDYEPVKRGRVIVAIRFTIKTLKQLAVEDVANLPEVQNAPENRPLWESVLKEWKLSQEKLDELAALLDTIPKSKLPEAEDTEQSKYKYIALKAAEIKRRSQEKRINNRFAYLKKMIDADIQKVQNATDPKSNTYVPTGTQAFRNYTERDPAANAEKYSKKIYDQYKQQQ